MTQLQDLSTALAIWVASTAPNVTAIQSHRSHSSGFVWRPGLILTAVASGRSRSGWAGLEGRTLNIARIRAACQVDRLRVKARRTPMPDGRAGRAGPGSGRRPEITVARRYRETHLGDEVTRIRWLQD